MLVYFKTVKICQLAQNFCFILQVIYLGQTDNLDSVWYKTKGRSNFLQVCLEKLQFFLWEIAENFLSGPPTHTKFKQRI